MPEIVEIEILKREVKAQLKDAVIKEAFANKETIINVNKDEFALLLKDKRIIDTRRKGKVLIIDLSSDISIVIHFLLTGTLRLLSHCDKEKIQVGFILKDGRCLAISGIMRGGFVKVVNSKDVFNVPELKKLGIDAMDKDFTLDIFKKIVQANGKKKIKQILMDQTLIAGIGNAYSDEILFNASVLPMRKANTLSSGEIEKIYQSISKVFNESFSYGGESTLTFVHLNGEKGKYQEHFKVHKRAGKPCLVCGTPIETAKVGGRTSFFCPHCQK